MLISVNVSRQSSSNYATLKDVQIKLREEECVRGMMQRSNYVAVTDVQMQMQLRKKEYALDMGQRSRYATATPKDAQTTLNKEECAGGTGQRPNYAAVKGVQMEPLSHQHRSVQEARGRGWRTSSGQPQWQRPRSSSSASVGYHDKR